MLLVDPHPMDVMQGWGDRRIAGQIDPDAVRTYFYECPSTSMDDMPGREMINHALATQGKATFARADFCPYPDYERTDAHQLWRGPAGAGDFTVLARVCPAAEALMIIQTNNRLGGRPISGRIVNAADLLIDMITPLVGSRLTLAHQRTRSGLSPRLRQTLDLLLRGLSEKQLAARLGLSRATVHEYITSLYRHFGVSGRAELMAYYVHRQAEGSNGVHAPAGSIQNQKYAKKLAPRPNL